MRNQNDFSAAPSVPSRSSGVTAHYRAGAAELRKGTMKEETLNALDMFIQQVTKAIRLALPDAPEAVKDVQNAAKELRDALSEEVL